MLQRIGLCLVSFIMGKHIFINAFLISSVGNCVKIVSLSVLQHRLAIDRVIVLTFSIYFSYCQWCFFFLIVAQSQDVICHIFAGLIIVSVR